MEAQMVQLVEGMSIDIQKTINDEAELQSQIALIRSKRVGMEAKRDELVKRFQEMKNLIADASSISGQSETGKSAPSSPTAMQNATTSTSPGSSDQAQFTQLTTYHFGHINDGPTTNCSPAMETGQVPASQIAGRPTDASTTDEETTHVTPLAKPRENTLYSLDTRLGQLTYDSLWRAARIPNYEVVAYIDWKWTEIGCGLCGRNATFDKDKKQFKYIGGPNGLITHIRSHFTEPEDKVLTKLIDNISRREVSDEDVALMREGKDPKVEIEKNVGTPSPKKKTPPKRKSDTKQSDITGKLGVDTFPSPFKRPRLPSNASKIASANADRQSEMNENGADDEEALPGENMKPES